MAQSSPPGTAPLSINLTHVIAQHLIDCRSAAGQFDRLPSSGMSLRANDERLVATAPSQASSGARQELLNMGIQLATLATSNGFEHFSAAGHGLAGGSYHHHATLTLLRGGIESLSLAYWIFAAPTSKARLCRIVRHLDKLATDLDNLDKAHGNTPNTTALRQTLGQLRHDAGCFPAGPKQSWGVVGLGQAESGPFKATPESGVLLKEMGGEYAYRHFSGAVHSTLPHLLAHKGTNSLNGQTSLHLTGNPKDLVFGAMAAVEATYRLLQARSEYFGRDSSDLHTWAATHHASLTAVWALLP